MISVPCLRLTWNLAAHSCMNNLWSPTVLCRRQSFHWRSRCLDWFVLAQTLAFLDSPLQKKMPAVQLVSGMPPKRQEQQGIEGLSWNLQSWYWSPCPIYTYKETNILRSGVSHSVPTAMNSASIYVHPKSQSFRSWKVRQYGRKGDLL